MSLSGGANIRARLSSGGNISVKLTPDAAISASISPVSPVAGVYDGPYEVTPNLETQTLSTERKIAAHNIVINPIPSNYGLITWDGSTLTVS